MKRRNFLKAALGTACAGVALPKATATAVELPEYCKEHVSTLMLERNEAEPDKYAWYVLPGIIKHPNARTILKWKSTFTNDDGERRVYCGKCLRQHGVKKFFDNGNFSAELLRAEANGLGRLADVSDDCGVRYKPLRTKDA